MANNDDQVNVSFSADTKSFNEAVSMIASNYDDAMKKIAAASDMSHVQAAMENATNRMAEALGGVADKAELFNAASGKMASSMAQLDSAADQAYSRISSSSKQAAAAGETVAHSTVSQRREIMVLAHEVMQGNFSRIPGSLMVLADRAGSVTGLLKQMVGAITSPIGLFIALAVAVAAVTAAFIRAEDEQERLTAMMGMTGDYAGQTAASIHAMSATIATSLNMSVGAVGEMAAKIAESGKIGKDAFASVTMAAAEYSRVTGESADKAADYVDKLFGSPGRGAREMSDTMHNLTADELDHIEMLDRTGNSAEAAKEAADHLTASLKDQTVHLGLLSKGVNAVASGWDKLKQAMLSFGSDDPTILLDRARESLKRLQEAKAMGIEGYGDEKQIAFYTTEIARLEKLTSLEQERAKAQQAQAEANAKAIHADDIAKKLDPMQRQIRLQEEINELVEAETKLPDGSAARAANIRAQIAAEKELESLEHPKQKVAKEDSIIPGYDMELQAEKQFMVAEQNGREMSLAEEAKYWRDKFNLGLGTTKDLQEMLKRANADELADMKEKQKQQQELAQTNLQEQEKLATDGVDAQIRATTQAFNMGQINRQQELSQLEAFEDKKTEIAEKGMADRITMMLSDPNYNPVALQKLLDQMQSIQDQAEVRKQETIDKSALATRKSFQDAFAPISRAFDTSITGMIMGTTTLQKAMQRITQSILGEFVSMGVKRVTTWLANEAMMLFATQTKNAAVQVSDATAATTASATKAAEATAVVGSNAAEGASAAAASVAAVPIVGPGLAIVAFAATMALILGARSLIHSSAGGEWNVPNDRLNFVHKGETILPAHVAEPMRNMFKNGAQQPQQVHIHAMDSQSVERLLTQNGSAVFNAMKRQLRGFNGQGRFA